MLLEDYACGLGFVKEIMPACSCMWVAKIADNIEIIGHLGWGVRRSGTNLTGNLLVVGNFRDYWMNSR